MFKGLMLSVAALTGVMGNMSDVDLIKDGEGYRQCTYKDTMGIRTVCYGFNLERGNARSEVQAAGGNYDSLMAGGCANQNICNKLLDTEVKIARKNAQSIFGTLSCPAAQAVAVDMTYNLGAATLGQFHTFNSLMKSGAYQSAANDLPHTAYCGQVGRRCTRNMKQIKTCGGTLMLLLLQ